MERPAAFGHGQIRRKPAMKSAIIGLTIVSAATVAYPAWAEPPQKFSFRGSSVYTALLSYPACTCDTDDDVCPGIEVNVSAFDDLSKQAPSPSQAYVNLYQID